MNRTRMLRRIKIALRKSGILDDRCVHCQRPRADHLLVNYLATAGTPGRPILICPTSTYQSSLDT